MAMFKVVQPFHSDEFNRAMRNVPGAQYDTPAAKAAWIAPKEQLDAIRAIKKRIFGAVATPEQVQPAAAAKLEAWKAHCGRLSEMDRNSRNYRQLAAAMNHWNDGDYDLVLRTLDGDPD